MKVVQNFDNNKNQIKNKLVIVALLMLIFPLFFSFFHFKYNWISNTIFYCFSLGSIICYLVILLLCKIFFDKNKSFDNISNILRIIVSILTPNY